MTDPLTGKVLEKINILSLPAANEYVVEADNMKESLRRIKDELAYTIGDFKGRNKLIEAQRIEERTTKDIEEMREFGFCSGVENYSRHLELREKGETPFTLFDYFGKD
jgi:excinuclease ABC subunit B